MEKQQKPNLDPVRSPDSIDTSLVEHSLKLSYEERIEANDSAIEVVKELQKAGQDLYAQQSKSPA